MRVFALLMEGDSCNCELKEKLGLPSNLLSHHLRMLRKVGLVNSRRDVIDGRWVYYSVDRLKVGHWQKWLRAFLDPKRIRDRQILCGPEGQEVVRVLAEQIEVVD
jgi:DNA-binding transcriptional ArsR family regulator